MFFFDPNAAILKYQHAMETTELKLLFRKWVTVRGSQPTPGNVKEERLRRETIHNATLLNNQTLYDLYHVRTFIIDLSHENVQKFVDLVSSLSLDLF